MMVDIAQIVSSAYAQAPGPLSARLSKWRTARARVLAGTGRARILCVGDSTTAGVGAFNSSPGLKRGAFPARIAEGLTGYGLPATKSNVVGTAALTPGAQYNTFNPDMVFNSANWVASGGSAGAAGFGNSVDSLAASYTPAVPVDTFEVTYLLNTGLGTLSYDVDGGSATLINCNASAAMAKVTISAGAFGTHTLNLKRSSGGNVVFFAIVGYNSAVKGIDVLNAGWGGSTSTNWNDTSTVYRPRPAIQFYAPDVLVLNLGINDRTPGTLVALPTYQTNLQAIITDNIATSDIIIMVPAPSDASRQTLAIQKQYNDVLYALALANNLPIIDTVQRWTSFLASPNMYLLAGDTVHPNELGYSDQAQLLTDFLRAA